MRPPGALDGRAYVHAHGRLHDRLDELAVLVWLQVDGYAAEADLETSALALQDLAGAALREQVRLAPTAVSGTHEAPP